MAVHLEDLAVRVRGVGLVAEVVPGVSYPLLVVRRPSPVMATVMAAAVHYWWYGEQQYPLAPVDDPAGALACIGHRLRAVGGRS